jgi:guanylate kinase
LATERVKRNINFKIKLNFLEFSYIIFMKIILVGKAAAGKDYFKNRLLHKGFKCGVSHTTRKPRKGEKDGFDYHYVSDDRFIDMMEDGDIMEHMEFKGWKYGLTFGEFHSSDVLIMSPEGLEHLSEGIKNKCLIIYLDIHSTTRLTRLILRDDQNDSITRRFEADENQFRNFQEYDLRITNPEF